MTQAASPARLWIAGLLPLVLLAGLVALIVRTSPGDSLRPAGTPPVERLSIDRARLGPDGITLMVMNDGPDPVTIAQVAVDDAYWAFTSDNGTVLKHLGKTVLRIPYPWVEGEAHLVKILTSTGTAFEHEIPVAVRSPDRDSRHLVIFTLIGLLVGVIPVALGLLWFPLVSRLGSRGLDIVLAVTIGLLLFLLIDTASEGLEVAAGLASSYQGIALFAAAAAGAWLALDGVSAWLRSRRRAERAAASPGAIIALLVAVGIGLHNAAEGLAIGSAFALGEATLGTLLIVGFTVHNTTEGVAIIAPVANERPGVGTLVKLGMIGGLPTIAGAWIGGLVYSPVVAVFSLGLGAGAIGQVVHQIAKQMAGDRGIAERFASGPILAGLAAGFGVMYATGMLAG
jgi:zinc transporter ZupT